MRARWAILFPLILAVLIACGVRVFSGRSVPGIFASRQIISIKPAVAHLSAHSGDTVECAFELCNESDDSVRILGVNSSCGCTTSMTDFPIDLTKGEKEQATFKIDVGPANAGDKFIRTVELLVNREGKVPPLVFDVTILKSSGS